MKPHLSVSQGRVIRAIGYYLSNGGKNSMMVTGHGAAVTLEAIESSPWSSLTFAGERHSIVLGLPQGMPAAPIDGDDLVVPGIIFAIERQAQCATAEGTRLSLDLLAIAR